MTEYSRNDVIKKGSSVVSAHPDYGCIFEPMDNTLFNYLLLRTYNEIEPGSNAIHHIPVREVMEYLRIDRVSKLQSSLERLSKGTILIDYLDSVSNEPRTINAHYLSSDVSRTGSGMLDFAFDAILQHFLHDPKVFAFISVGRIRDLKTTASQKLYELMSLQFRKKSPTWNVTPDELRSLLQVGNKNLRFDNFRVHVLEKAIEDVNAIAEFDVLVNYVRGGKGGGVIEIVLKAVSKSHKRLLDAASIKSIGVRRSKNIDPHTVDLLDGKTFVERGGPAEISADAVETARGMMDEGSDVNVLVSEWREQNRGRSMNEPDRMFLSWLEFKLAQDNDPFLKDIDADVFGDLLGGRE